MAWKAGTASTVITPSEPLWLAGYAARTTPAQGRISDLWVSALALEDEDGNRVVIASADLIAITKIIADPVLARVRETTGLTRAQVILAATHTHYGPEVRPDKAPFFGIPPQYAAKIAATAEAIAGKMAMVITEAVERLGPARVSARVTKTSFAHNRRRTGVKGGNASVDDVLDHDVHVLDVVDTTREQRKAVVFGYACHNTTIPPDDARYCADWAGFAAEQLQLDLPGITTLFVAGCGADQNPEPRGSVALSRQCGKDLADSVQASLRTEAREIAGPIRVARDEIALAMDVPTRERLIAILNDSALEDPPQKAKARFLLDQLDRGEALIREYAAPIQAVRLGDELLWIVLSGEPVIDWAIQLKRAFAAVAPVVWVSGYCNDMPGYLPTRRIQQEGGYEGGRANLWSWLPGPWTADVEDRVTAAVERLVRQVV